MIKKGTIRLEFSALGKVIFFREYNNADAESILDEFKFIADLKSFQTPNKEPFDRVEGFWQYDGQERYRQWTLLVD